MSAVRKALFIMSEAMAKDATLTLDDAAQRVHVRYPALVLEVLDIIGSWPSSERALRALQKVTL